MESAAGATAPAAAPHTPPPLKATHTHTHGGDGGGGEGDSFLFSKFTTFTLAVLLTLLIYLRELLTYGSRDLLAIFRVEELPQHLTPATVTPSSLVFDRNDIANQVHGGRPRKLGWWRMNANRIPTWALAAPTARMVSDFRIRYTHRGNV